MREDTPQLYDDLDKEGATLEAYARKLGVSAAECNEAYERMMGAADGEASSSGVAALEVRMRELADAGYPVNRFAVLIGKWQRGEEEVAGFEDFLQQSNFNESEQRMLRSIVEKERTGKIECSVNGQVFATMNIKIAHRNDVAAELVRSLQAAQELAANYELDPRKIELSFEANE